MKCFVILGTTSPTKHDTIRLEPYLPWGHAAMPSFLAGSPWRKGAASLLVREDAGGGEAMGREAFRMVVVRSLVQGYYMLLLLIGGLTS